VGISRRSCVFYDGIKNSRNLVSSDFHTFNPVLRNATLGHPTLFQTPQTMVLKQIKQNHCNELQTSTQSPAQGLLRCVRIPAEHIQKSISPYVRPYACTNSRPDQHIFRQFYNETVRMFQILGKIEPTRGHSLSSKSVCMPVRIHTAYIQPDTTYLLAGFRLH
jgi:hypothetical protein